MDFEQMKKIVDGAPDSARYYCTSANIYITCAMT